MSDRKYRQRGYQDDPRDREKREAPKSPPPGPRERGPREPRVPNMPGFRDVARCGRCGNVLTSAGVALDARCARCGTDLHACVHCAFFDTGSRFECSEPITARIASKDTRNECTVFQVRTKVERETHSAAPDDARKAFDDLFK